MNAHVQVQTIQESLGSLAAVKKSLTDQHGVSKRQLTLIGNEQLIWRPEGQELGGNVLKLLPDGTCSVTVPAVGVVGPFDSIDAGAVAFLARIPRSS